MASLAATGFDTALLLGVVGYLLGRSGGESSSEPELVGLRFVPCHCDRPQCSGVRRLRVGREA